MTLFLTLGGAGVALLALALLIGDHVDGIFDALGADIERVALEQFLGRGADLGRRDRVEIADHGGIGVIHRPGEARGRVELGLDLGAHRLGRCLEGVVALLFGQGALDFRLQFLGVALHEFLRLGPAESLGLHLEVIEQALRVLGGRDARGVFLYRDSDLAARLQSLAQLRGHGRRHGGHLFDHAGLHEGLRVDEHLLHRAGLGRLRNKLLEGFRVAGNELVGGRQLVERSQQFGRLVGALHLLLALLGQ